jgi:hypothetical protein
VVTKNLSKINVAISVLAVAEELSMHHCILRRLEESLILIGCLMKELRLLVAAANIGNIIGKKAKRPL